VEAVPAYSDVHSQHLHGWTGTSQKFKCPGQVLDVASPEHNSEVLLLVESCLMSFVKKESVLVDIIHRNNVLRYIRTCSYHILSIQIEALKGNAFFLPLPPAFPPNLTSM
jgi:hypothetical protein